MLWTTRFVLLSAILSALPFVARSQTGFPFQNESLHYSVNWPSGLTLGEASLSANHVSDGWSLEMTLDARIPGFAIADRFHSLSDPDQCSQEFERNISQGHKKTSEKRHLYQRKAWHAALRPVAVGRPNLPFRGPLAMRWHLFTMHGANWRKASLCLRRISISDPRTRFVWNIPARRRLRWRERPR